jgi:hypothetical protein
MLQVSTNVQIITCLQDHPITFILELQAGTPLHDQDKLTPWLIFVPVIALTKMADGSPNLLTIAETAVYTPSFQWNYFVLGPYVPGSPLGSILVPFLFLLGLRGRRYQIVGTVHCSQPHFRIPTSQNDIQRAQASIAIR